MRCPFCDSDKLRVIDSRPSEEQNSIRRRRICDACKKRFTTYEMIEPVPIMVIKKDNTRELYSRNKLISGLLRSCHKRSVSEREIEDLVDSIENEIYKSADKEIRSSYIGELVMEKLREIDQVAYVRFASIYREFTDVDNFIKEVNLINKKDE